MPTAFISDWLINWLTGTKQERLSAGPVGNGEVSIIATREKRTWLSPWSTFHSKKGQGDWTVHLPRDQWNNIWRNTFWLPNLYRATFWETTERQKGALVPNSQGDSDTHSKYMCTYHNMCSISLFCGFLSLIFVGSLRVSSHFATQWIRHLPVRHLMEVDSLPTRVGVLLQKKPQRVICCVCGLLDARVPCDTLSFRISRWKLQSFTLQSTFNFKIIEDLYS